MPCALFARQELHRYRLAAIGAGPAPAGGPRTVSLGLRASSARPADADAQREVRIIDARRQNKGEDRAFFKK